jgi:hypothetical protein
MNSVEAQPVAAVVAVVLPVVGEMIDMKLVILDFLKTHPYKIPHRII